MDATTPRPSMGTRAERKAREAGGHIHAWKVVDDMFFEYADRHDHLHGHRQTTFECVTCGERKVVRS